MAEENALSPTEDDQDKIVVDLDEAPAGEESGEQQEAAAEVEIVDEEAGSQPGKPKKGAGARKLVGRLKAAKQETSEASAALVAEREKSQLLELALEQEREAKANVLPNPDDFDGGAGDPAYMKQITDYTEGVAVRAVQKHTANIPAAPAGNANLDRLQVAHSERAEELNIADYADVQDKAIEIIGLTMANEIISASDRSEVILYHLGKNPGAAEDLRNLIASNPVKGAFEIGRLEERLKVKPRASTQSIPDPDVEVQGGTPTAGKTNQFQKRLEKARAGVGDGSLTMSAILKIKKEALAAGVTVN